MKKIINTKSVTFKSILLLLICSLIFIIIAMPVINNITFNVLKPFLVNHIKVEITDSTALLSDYLGRTNPSLYMRTSETTELIENYSTGTYDKDEFESLISEKIEPLETIMEINDETLAYKSYPAIYIDGKGLFCNEDVKAYAETLIGSEWFENYKENRNTEMIYAPLLLNGDNNQFFCYVYSNNATNFTYYRTQTTNTIFYTFLFTDFNDLNKMWDNIEKLSKDFVLVGPDDDIIYQNVRDTKIDTSWMQNNVISDRQHHVVMYEDEDDVYYSVLVSYENEGLRFLMHVSREDFFELYKSSIIIIQVIFVIFILLFILLTIVLIKKILKKLAVFSDKMAVVQNGNYDVKLDYQSEDEFGQLATVFNIMTDKIQVDIDRLLEKENREKMLQYNLMVSAIDPHFIYNTLNTSTRLAELGRIEDVVEVNDALINCMKDNLKMKSFQSYDTIENERKTLEQYIKIQNFLCDNSIELTFNIDDKDLQLKIPKFLLQPIVENSILHGIIMNVDPNGDLIEGKINISVQQEEKIKITVEDNGIGMSGDTIQKFYYSDEKVMLESDFYSHHIGILNIKTRLSYLYGEHYSIKVNSIIKKGTKIEIEIPNINL